MKGLYMCTYVCVCVCVCVYCNKKAKHISCLCWQIQFFETSNHRDCCSCISSCRTEITVTLQGICETFSGISKFLFINCTIFRGISNDVGERVLY